MNLIFIYFLRAIVIDYSLVLWCDPGGSHMFG